jgi:uncharacterized OsmC-like protein
LTAKAADLKRRKIMTTQTKIDETNVINGIDVMEFANTVQAVKAEPELGKFQFRGTNRWEMGGYNRTTIRGFYGAGEEHGAEDRSFVLEADEPPILFGEDRTANPVEYLLHALASCLTSSIIYKAAARGITIESVESKLEGDLDARAFLELSNDVRMGYQKIRASFKIKSDASAEELKKCAEFSPVLDVITHGTPVSLRVEKA